MFSNIKVNQEALKEIRERLPFLVGALAVSAVLYFLGSLLWGFLRILTLMFATLSFLGAAGLGLQILWVILHGHFKMDANKVAIYIGALLAGLFSLFLVVGLTNEGVRIYRGWTNRDGTLVEGFGLYEKEIRSERLSRIMPDILLSNRPPEWDVLGFYQYEFLCNWEMSRRQKAWKEERQRKLKVKMSATEDSPNLYEENELPVVRYACAPTKMLYQAGMGWGLF